MAIRVAHRVRVCVAKDPAIDAPLSEERIYSCPSTHRHVFEWAGRNIMDADIQDILDSVSVPSLSQRTLDLQALTRAWVNERTAPELLPYPASLIDRIMDRIKKQVSAIGGIANSRMIKARRKN